MGRARAIPQEGKRAVDYWYCRALSFVRVLRYDVCMAKRTYVDIRRKKSRSKKTAKRLAAKAVMLAAKKAKKTRGGTR